MSESREIGPRLVRGTMEYWINDGFRIMIVFFFFQAEDGIRDYKVTGVQTCALPISAAACQGMNRSETITSKPEAGAARYRRPSSTTRRTPPCSSRRAFQVAKYRAAIDRKSVV